MDGGTVKAVPAAGRRENLEEEKLRRESGGARS
jgi:hypothetical protein